MIRRLAAWILALLLVCSLAVQVFAAETTETEQTETEAPREPGQCGDNMSWSYGDGVLTITGEGEMDDFEEDAPWVQHKEEIHSVVLSGGITYIGARAFRDYDRLETVDFGDALYEIGAEAFRGCDGLKEIHLPGTFKIFGESSFENCGNLTEIHSEGKFPSFRQNSLWNTYAKIYYPAERPWNVELIQELEEAFQGRIEFIASDGADPYVPTEPATESEETEPETVPPTTQAPTEPEVTEQVTEGTEATQPQTAETLPAETETQPAQTTIPETEPAKEGDVSGILIGSLIVAGVLTLLVLGALIFRRGIGGKYSR